ncbi:MAG: BMP family ABC transporter substrate-binding protein [Clostridia bacterium]|nr:BMP family ABC transporter substrate-binding protein [Clostridia bacterium]
MKRVLALILALAMCCVLFVGCGKEETNTNGSGDEPAGSSYKVAMITDYGDITDESFNQTTYEACKAFCDENKVEFTYKKPAGDSTADRVAMIEQAAGEGYNVIVMPGYAFGGAIVEAAKDYPDVKFVALDVAKGDLLEAGVAAAGEQYDYNPDNWDLAKYVDMSNVYCAIYQEELCGYMAGYAAVKLGYTKLGFLGGMAVPAVVRYGFGFVQGADAAAAELGVKPEIKYVYGGQFFGDADITAKMDTWYQAGTEVVFACGGGIYISAAEAAQKVGGKVIGVDVDQAAIIDGKYGAGITVTSAMKGLYPATYDALKDIIINDKWDNYKGKIETLGLISGTDVEKNYVQIPYESTQWAEGKFTKDDYVTLVGKMFDGTIKVSNATDKMPAVTAVTVDDQGNIK